MVAGTSNPHRVASAIAGAVQAGKPPTCRAVGAGAVNQMVKACAIARGQLASQGYDLVFRPGFENVPGRPSDKDEMATSITMKAICS
jgi:stage V sporulation protein S